MRKTWQDQVNTFLRERTEFNERKRQMVRQGKHRPIKMFWVIGVKNGAMNKWISVPSLWQMTQSLSPKTDLSGFLKSLPYAHIKTYPLFKKTFLTLNYLKNKNSHWPSWTSYLKCTISKIVWRPPFLFIYVDFYAQHTLILMAMVLVCSITAFKQFIQVAALMVVSILKLTTHFGSFVF